MLLGAEKSGKSRHVDKKIYLMLEVNHSVEPWVIVTRFSCG